jgi:hypothetical protein
VKPSEQLRKLLQFAGHRTRTALLADPYYRAVERLAEQLLDGIEATPEQVEKACVLLNRDTGPASALWWSRCLFRQDE